MRNTILASVASIALFGGAFASSAFATGPSATQQQTYVLSAGQGGSITISIPAYTAAAVAVVADSQAPAAQGRLLQVTAGNGGTVPTFVPANETAVTPETPVASIAGN